MNMHQQPATCASRGDREQPALRRRPRYSLLLAVWFAAALAYSPLSAAAQTGSQAGSEPPAASMTPGETPAQHPATSPDTTAPAASPTSPKPPASLPTVDNSKYIIGSDDTLQITVWREPTLTGALPVRPDGMISLVLIGDIKASGRTPMQLGDDITQRLKKYIQDPSVTVAVTGVNSQRVYVVGEVGRVGPLPLTPDMTVLQAISTAGGPTPYANVKHIYILRGSGTKKQQIPFNYKKALKGDNQPGATLQPGDTIVIP